MGGAQVTGYHSERFPCFRRGQDVVIPDMNFTPAHLISDFSHWTLKEKNYTAANWKRRLGQREQTLVFAGEIIAWQVETLQTPPEQRVKMSGNSGESANVRLLTYLYHKDRPGYLIAPSEAKKWNFWEMQTSKFCLAPQGMLGHWGRRVVQAVLLGCVPVIIQDNFEQPLEPFLPYDQFSVRVAEADIPRLHEILDAVTPQQLADMQARPPSYAPPCGLPSLNMIKEIRPLDCCMTQVDTPWPERSYFLLSGERSERAACRVEAVRLALGATKAPDCRYGLVHAASDRHDSCHMPQ